MSDLASLVQSIIEKSLGSAPISVQHKRMTKSEWSYSSVILREGEIGIETDTGYLKVGDGRNRFSYLKYLTGPKGDTGPQGPPGPPGASSSYSGGGTTNGYVQFDSLTSEQKLQLKGDKGEKGDPGPRGLPGQDGADGQPGKNGADGKSITVQTMTKSSFDRLLGTQSNVLYIVTEG